MAEGSAGAWGVLLTAAALYGLWRLAKALTGADPGRKRACSPPAQPSRTSRGDQTWAQLQAHRTVETGRGLMVRSSGERRVADLLDRLGIPYEYERPMHGYYPDFYVPQWDLVIEYWGMDPPGSPKRRAKVACYLRAGHKLIHLEPEDAPRLEDVLLRKLYRFDQGVYRRLEAARAHDPSR